MQLLRSEPAGEERDRRETMLKRQLDSMNDVQKKSDEMRGHFESCVLAIQTMRSDLLRLRVNGIGAVANELTQATQAARALSRDVDIAIAAAGEMREAMK
jgi:serine/threonine-protein kinase